MLIVYTTLSKMNWKANIFNALNYLLNMAIFKAV